MPGVMTLYADDSGTRNPDRNPTDLLPSHQRDWFGLGGVIVHEEDEISIRAQHQALIDRWPITKPLHSSEIRARSQNFAWLEGLDRKEHERFLTELGAVATASGLTAIACVIDRPNYNKRYKGKFRKRWLLCKTAFHILVERSAKFALSKGCRLRVYFEKSDRDTDRRLNGYYRDLLANGLPFDDSNSSKYQPLTVEAFRSVLYGFKTKDKSSPLMQLADVCLWPMCLGGYEPTCIPYEMMRKAGTLIDCQLEESEIAQQGIKYSCLFD